MQSSLDESAVSSLESNNRKDFHALAQHQTDLSLDLDALFLAAKEASSGEALGEAIRRAEASVESTPANHPDSIRTYAFLDKLLELNTRRVLRLDDGECVPCQMYVKSLLPQRRGPVSKIGVLTEMFVFKPRQHPDYRGATRPA